MIQDIMHKSRLTEAYKDESDEAVLLASRTAPDVFGVLVDRYEAAFLRKAKSIVGTREDAEEVVQDTFTRMYLYADRYRAQEGATFSSWGYAILTRLCFTRYQKLKRKGLVTAPLESETYERLPDTLDFVDELTIRDEVFTALARLPEAMARVLKLQFLEGKTQEEIAVLEASTVPAIKTRVHRAKKLFKESLNYGKQHKD